MPEVHFDRFFRYDELTRLLQDYVVEFPQLVELESLGKSYEGRDIWLLRVTNLATGPDTQKPALWVDGNIHATELAPSTACLYLLHWLTQEYDRDPLVTRCLDTRALYLCPRVNPDGAERALADEPEFLRSSVRPYPGDGEPDRGSHLVPRDADGDGWVLTMRLPDPNGAWKPCPKDPRLMVRREPEDIGGRYYRLLPEGIVENYDGAIVEVPPPPAGLDLNRNFPAGWRQEFQQTGAGPYPASEPETRALAQFVTQARNLTGAIAFHTCGGLLLRPYSDAPDDRLPEADLDVYKLLGRKGTDLTGYPAVSVFEDFCDRPDQAVTGAFDDWCYEHCGLFAWTVEIWSLLDRAGVKDWKLPQWYWDHPLEDDLKLLRWCDEHLGDRGFVPWYAFEHPQLGAVELGGWDDLRVWRNPPAHLLAEEVAKFPRWIAVHLLASPLLAIAEARADRLGAVSELGRGEVAPWELAALLNRQPGNGLFRVRVVVQNTGFLPTHITQKALDRSLVRPCVCEIHLPETATLEVGRVRTEIGHLSGWSDKPSVAMSRQSDPTRDRAKVEWIVAAPKGTRVRVTAAGDRAGKVEAAIVLD